MPWVELAFLYNFSAPKTRRNANVVQICLLTLVAPDTNVLGRAGSALRASPRQARLWEMLVWCQSLWIDAMLSLHSLRVFLPDEVGAMLRNIDAAESGWHEAPLTHVELSRETGVLSLTLETPVSLVDSKTGSFELRVGRKGAGMWAVHDEVCWHDCVPDDALHDRYSIICTSVAGNTWLGWVDGDGRYLIKGVQLLLLRSRLGSGEGREPSELLYKAWSKYGDISATWVQTWIMTLPHTAATPLRLARSGGGGREGGGGGGGSDFFECEQDEEEDTSDGGTLGSDIKALRFYASCLTRLVPAAIEGRPYSVLKQQALDATSLAVLKTLARCGGTPYKVFPSPEWWRPPLVLPLVEKNASTYADCYW